MRTCWIILRRRLICWGDYEREDSDGVEWLIFCSNIFLSLSFFVCFSNLSFSFFISTL